MSNNCVPQLRALIIFFLINPKSLTLLYAQQCVYGYNVRVHTNMLTNKVPRASCHTSWSVIQWQLGKN